MAVANVGIADYKIIKSPDQIMTVGLGSCCGVVIYDEINKIAGLVHILLSESKTEKNLTNRAKFADTGITLLYEELRKKGANPRFMKAKMAGGAHMFNFNNSNNALVSIVPNAGATFIAVIPNGKCASNFASLK